MGKVKYELNNYTNLFIKYQSIEVMTRKKLINIEFSEIFSRIRKETNIKNYVQLAEIIDVTQQAVSMNKKKNIFPVEWAYLIAEKYNLDLVWLLKGEGLEKVKEKPEKARTNALLDEIDNWLGEKAKKEPEIVDWFKYEFLRKFPEFAEWKRKTDSKREDSLAQKISAA